MNRKLIHLRPLSAQVDQPIAQTLRRAAELLSDLQEDAVLQLRIRSKTTQEPATVYNIVLTARGAHLSSGTPEPQDSHFSILVAEDDLRRIASGSYSPVQAFRDRKLYIQGDVALAKRVVLHLADEASAASAATPVLLEEAWTADNNDATGTLEVSGVCFTPNGAIQLTYDWAGVKSRRVTQADQSGAFSTIAEPGLICDPDGDGPGVTVTAVDVVSGISTSQRFATPC